MLNEGGRQDWTENQDPGISFMKLSEIGYEPYRIYFKGKRKEGSQ